jgi:murein DD-endopeptidase MepM/ murein hydrolase activator NlpD
MLELPTNRAVQGLAREKLGERSTSHRKGLRTPMRREDEVMRQSYVAIVLLSLLLFVIEPMTRELGAPLRLALVRTLAVMVLPFRLAWLSAQPPDAVLLMPVAGAQVRGITDTWGAPRPDGRRHQGQDIFAKIGTAVFSATRGYVVRVGSNALGGNVLVIAGAGGRRYYYAHLEGFAPDLWRGKPVTPETIIGFVGNTGNASRTPPHLHFAMYTMVGTSDPLPLLRDRPPSPL